MNPVGGKGVVTSVGTYYYGLLMILLYFVNLFGLPQLANGISVEKDLRLSLDEKLALDKFKTKMIPRMPHDYMKTDIYLIRWLRAKRLNQNEAERMLLDNLEWRKKFEMDTISDEDWKDMTEGFGFNYTTSTFDKEGRPIGMSNIGTWDMRRAALAGKMPRTVRLGFKCLEEVTQAVLKQQELGKQVTQWKVLFNMDDFNVVKGACPQCIAAYLTFVQALEARYPGWADQIIIVNTPDLFKTLVLDVVRPFLSERTGNALRVFGRNQEEWGPYLDKEISRDQRLKIFGGTLEESY